ncbi:hypothetical protein AALB53_08585 [Lachnospiraceae bacterium 47-T17]
MHENSYTERVELLNNNGWVPVKSRSSGVYGKNGFYLVFQHNPDCFPGNKKVEDNTLAAALLFYDVKGMTWHLEKDGWFLAGGRMSNDIQDLLHSVDEIMHKDNLELFSHRKHYVTHYKSAQVYKAFEVAGSVKETLCFTVTRKIDAFVPGEVYQIINFVDNVLYVQKYNKALTKLLSAVYPVTEIQGFFKANEAGIIQTVQVRISTENVPFQELEPVVCADNVELPSALRDLPFSTERKIAIGAAFSMAKNFALLLDITYGDECIAALMQLINSNADLTAFRECDVSADVLQRLVDLHLAGRDVTSIANIKLLIV